MIHTNIGYGYKFDDETKTLIGEEGIKSYGFFSTFTLMFICIINVYKDLNMIVENIDGSNLLENLKQGENLDMYHHFFNINKDLVIDVDKNKIPRDLSVNEQHTIYKDVNFVTFKPFFEKYFNLNQRLIDLIDFYKTKYRIDSDRSISVVYRDTDKWTDFGGFNYISPAFYWRIARNLKTEDPSLALLVQTENTGVKRIFREALGGVSIEETLTSETSEYPLFLTLKNEKLKWADAYVASLWLHSKSKYLITYTGNSGFFLYLARGTTKNMYQEITFTKNDENEFFVLNA
jgi:hypothetical protein